VAGRLAGLSKNKKGEPGVLRAFKNPKTAEDVPEQTNEARGSATLLSRLRREEVARNATRDLSAIESPPAKQMTRAAEPPALERT